MRNIALIIAAIGALSACFASSPEWTDPIHIKEVWVSSTSGNIYVVPESGSTNFKNPSICTSADAYTIAPSSNLDREMYSALLSAASTYKQVKLYLAGDECSNGRAQIIQVRVLY